MTHEEINAQDDVSTVRHFVLLGFSDLPDLRGFLSGLFTVIYLVVLIGNGLIITITRLDPALQRPMYFFLANFSSLEICYVSVTIPRILFNLCTQNRNISVMGCATQLCFFLILGTTESFLLAVMSYDRHVAICHPLHYALLMNPQRCARLAAGSWLGGVPVQVGQTCQIFSPHFCNSSRIDHFFCDAPLLRLACGDASAHEASVYVVVMVVVAVPFLLILASYSKIISTILRLPTAKGRAKAFSTCSSHLLVVVLFFGSATITYFRPKSSHSAGTDKLLSLFYTVVTPMLNPLIYSLGNKDVIAALRKLFLKTQCRGFP
ncbi:LOW QUALITY PROTEIN: olfactory receptor 10AG1-like [Erethizon dorsatum]